MVKPLKYTLVACGLCIFPDMRLGCTQLATSHGGQHVRCQDTEGAFGRASDLSFVSCGIHKGPPESIPGFIPDMYQAK